MNYMSQLNALAEKGGNAAVLAMFLADFAPGDPDEHCGDNMTSREIVDALEDTTELTVTEVSDAMTFLGYKLHRNEYRCHEWAMRSTLPKGGQSV